MAVNSNEHGIFGKKSGYEVGELCFSFPRHAFLSAGSVCCLGQNLSDSVSKRSFTRDFKELCLCILNFRKLGSEEKEE